MAQALNFAPRLAGVGRPGGERQRQRAVDQTRAEHGDKGKGQNQPRHRHHHVGKAHQSAFQPAAVVAGENAHQQAGWKGNQGDQRDQP